MCGSWYLEGIGTKPETVTRDFNYEDRTAVAIASGTLTQSDKDDLARYAGKHGLELVMAWPTYNTYIWVERRPRPGLKAKREYGHCPECGHYGVDCHCHEDIAIETDPRANGHNYGAPLPISSLSEVDQSFVAASEAIAREINTARTAIGKSAWALDMLLRDVRHACTKDEQARAIDRLRDRLLPEAGLASKAAGELAL